MGLEVYGTEINEKQIQYCEKMGIKILKWEEIPNFKFDIINIEQVLEHVDNPSEIIKYLSNFLQSKGILKIGVPDGSHVKTVLSKKIKASWFFEKKNMKKSLTPVEPLQHLNAFNYNSLNYLMRKNGQVHLTKPIGSYHKMSIHTFNIRNLMYYYARMIIPKNYKTYLLFEKT